LIGSYGYRGAHSSFTNFGQCVDAYAPGENVIGHLPGDWLFPLAGTSFSAPLVVRWLSMTAPRPFAPATARADLVATREPDRNLLASHFPADLLYDPSGRAYAGATGALTGNGTGTGTGSAVAAARPPAPGLVEDVDFARAAPRAVAAALDPAVGQGSSLSIAGAGAVAVPGDVPGARPISTTATRPTPTACS